MQKKLWPVLWLIIVSGCQSVAIKNTDECSVAGVLGGGMICAGTLSGETSEMDLGQTIEFLEPQPERPDPKNPGKMLPARAGALCRSMDDALVQKTALEQACRLLGDRCTYELKQLINTMGAIISAHEKVANGSK